MTFGIAGAVSGAITGIAQLIGARAARRRQEAATRQALEYSDRGVNYLRDAYGGFVDQGRDAGALQAGLLGIGDSAASNAAFQRYLDSTGYQFELGQGQNSIASSAAARGGLNSGATLRALQRYGQGLAGQRFDNYLNNLNGITDRGFRAGGAIADAYGRSATIASQVIPQGAAVGNSLAQQGQSGLFNGLGAVVGGAQRYFENRAFERSQPLTRVNAFNAPRISV